MSKNKDNFAIDTSKEVKTSKDKIKLLMLTTYKDSKIYIRQIGFIFLWDVIFKDEMYSSFFVIKPEKGKINLNKNQINEIIKMCYAGAASTIDYQRGDRISETDEKIVQMFEEARNKIEGDKKDA